MATDVSICSNALRRLGDSPITSLTDDTERARLCNSFFTDARDTVLRTHPWNFSITRASLAQLSEAPAYGFSYMYALPTNPYCLRVLEMEYPDYIFKIENDALGEKICEMELSLPGPKIFASSKEKNFEMAVKETISDIQKQLKKRKELTFRANH